MVVGYLLTVAVELPILVVGLGSAHALGRRVGAGFWLTACTYPVVVLVLPALMAMSTQGSRTVFLLIAETFAPLAECCLFLAGFGRLSKRDAAVIVIANLASFGFGELLIKLGWW